jgi:hypothetical protein
MKPCLILCASSLIFSHLSQAAVIGFEDFSYPDGSINGAAGGTGWNSAGGTSDWGGTPQVVSGGLVTDGPASLPYGSHPAASPAYSSAYREYGGDESASAVQGVGRVCFKFSATTSSDSVIPSYLGLSSFDFGTETVFFGLVDNGFGFSRWGIQEIGGAQTLSFTPPLSGATITLVGIVDFDNNVLSLFINPDGSDLYNPLNPTAGTNNTADVVQTGFTSSSWSTRLRVQSASPILTAGTVTWDNLTVGTSPTDVGLAVPEPATFALLTLAGGLSLARRRSRS